MCKAEEDQIKDMRESIRLISEAAKVVDKVPIEVEFDTPLEVPLDNLMSEIEEARKHLQ